MDGMPKPQAAKAKGDKVGVQLSENLCQGEADRQTQTVNVWTPEGTGGQAGIGRPGLPQGYY